MAKSLAAKLGVTLGGLALLTAIGAVNASAAPEVGEAGVYLTKTLEATDPAVAPAFRPELVFEFASKEVGYYKFLTTGELDKTAAAGVDLPDLTAPTLKFSKDEVSIGTGTGTKTVSKQSKNITPDFSGAEPGMYVYYVTENARGGSTQVDPATGENLTFDGSTFVVRFFVKSDGSSTGTVEKPVTPVDPTKPIDPENLSGSDGDKVDVDNKVPTTPGIPLDPTTNPPVEPTDENGTVVTEPNGFAFKNVYTIDANNTTDPIDPANPVNAPFWVGKNVVGELVSKNMLFDFTIKIEPGDIHKVESYQLKIVDPTDPTKSQNFQEIKVGEEISFQLHHGQKVYFEKDTVPAGTVITVKETAVADFETKNVSTWNDVATKTVSTEASGTLGTGKNAVDYTNTNYNTVTPTGILMNNLPYISLIVAAVVGLGFYILNKRRHV